MITIRIGKKIKIQKYLLKGIKIFLKHNDKWYCIKLNENQLEGLKYSIDILNNNYEK